jgi:thiamine pyrophosphokinase
VVALILADADVPSRMVLDSLWPGWGAAVELVVAADGGARHAAALGVDIDLWVGDGDSIDAAALDALVAAGVEIEKARPDKDESDTELAVRAALRRGVDGVVLLGATGGPRIDHELANLGLLAMPDLRGRTAVVYTPGSRIRLLAGRPTDERPRRCAIGGSIGDLVSLLPFGADAIGVRTHGLAYPLVGERLPAGVPRGLSNVIAEDGAWVSLESGALLVIETPGTIVR